MKKDVKRQLFFSGRYGIYPKMTGAGGGGCLYAFLKPGEIIWILIILKQFKETSQTLLNMIKDELRKDGYEMWQPALGGKQCFLYALMIFPKFI